MIKKILLGILVILIGGFSYAYLTYFPQIPAANGYVAKTMCSCTFISGRSQESIQNEDLGESPFHLTSTEIDHENQSVTTSMYGMAPRTAVFRGDVGCILLDGDDNHKISLALNRSTKANILPSFQKRGLDTPPDSSEANLTQLEQAIQNAFDPSLRMDSIKTRAVVVMHKGQVIAEKYAEGIDADTEILGWSMTKSITSTMVGILVKNGLMNLEDNNLFPEWTDERKDISLKDLLQMQSGLDFVEEYSRTRLSDVTKMLFTSENVFDLPVAKELKYPPGTHWYYSSGTTNLLSKLVKKKLSEEAYLRLPYDSIFNPIGMNTAIMETDETGIYIGSSFCYATPRDWAKFGQLYLQQGNWNGHQVIDTSWVDFVRTPAAHSKGNYGGQFWLNVNKSRLKDAPEDLYSCNGHLGQYVLIIPSYDLVIVRMGLASPPIFDLNKFVKEVLDCFDPISKEAEI